MMKLGNLCSLSVTVKLDESSPVRTHTVLPPDIRLGLSTPQAVPLLLHLFQCSPDKPSLISFPSFTVTCLIQVLVSDFSLPR